MLGNDWIKGSTKLHFRGQSILRESIKTLATLGMAKATHVLLTGVVWSGTGVVLHADTIGALLKAAIPGLQVYKALPVLGFLGQTHLCCFMEKIPLLKQSLVEDNRGTSQDSPPHCTPSQLQVHVSGLS